METNKSSATLPAARGPQKKAKARIEPEGDRHYCMDGYYSKEEQQPHQVTLPVNWEIIIPSADERGEHTAAAAAAATRRRRPCLVLKRHETVEHTRKLLLVMLIWNGLCFGATFVAQIYWLLAMPHHLVGYLLLRRWCVAQFTSTCISATTAAATAERGGGGEAGQKKIGVSIRAEGLPAWSVGCRRAERSVVGIGHEPHSTLFGIFNAPGDCAAAAAAAAHRVFAVDSTGTKHILVSGLLDPSEAEFVKYQLDQELNLDPGILRQE